MEKILLSNYVRKIITSILLLAFLLAFFQGCYSYKIGELERIERIPGSKELQFFNYSVRVIKSPTVGSPDLKLNLIQKPIYKTNARQFFREEKWSDPLKTWLIPTAVMGAAAIGSSKTGEIVTSAAFAIGFLALGIFDEGSYIGITDELIEGEVIESQEEGQNEPARNIDLSITINRIIKGFTSDQEGEISINLVNDFGLVRFKSPSNIKVKFSSIYYKINENISLESRIWTVPFIKIKQNNVSVETEKGEKLVKLGELSEGEEYKILYESNDLIKIDFNGEEGYIEKNAGEKFWAVTNYLEK